MRKTLLVCFVLAVAVGVMVSEAKEVRDHGEHITCSASDPTDCDAHANLCSDGTAECRFKDPGDAMGECHCLAKLPRADHHECAVDADCGADFNDHHSCPNGAHCHLDHGQSGHDDHGHCHCNST